MWADSKKFNRHSRNETGELSSFRNDLPRPKRVKSAFHLCVTIKKALNKTAESLFLYWSGRLDLNQRPLVPQTEIHGL